MRIVFILGSISQPRCIKRIRSFIDCGIEVEVYGFDRGKQNINASIYGKKINVISKQELGKKHINRFFHSLKAIREIEKKYEDELVIYYSFGFIPTLILSILNVKFYVYEISDILYGYKKFLGFRWVFKAIDKLLIKRSILTVLTSKGFLNYFFADLQPKNVIIQPNKMHYSFMQERINEKVTTINDNLVFSFVGAFRSPETIFRFAKIIGEKYPHHEFHFYGDSHLTAEVISLSKAFNNIKYFGPFKNPEHLTNIYSKIDIVIACYNNNDLNERILEPNKLYEALYFRKPIVVSENTFLAERVKHYGCGYVINALNNNSIIDFIDSINLGDLNKIITNIEKVDMTEVIDDNSINIINSLNKYLKKIGSLSP